MAANLSGCGVRHGLWIRRGRGGGGDQEGWGGVTAAAPSHQIVCQTPHHFSCRAEEAEKEGLSCSSPAPCRESCSQRLKAHCSSSNEEISL